MLDELPLRPPLLEPLLAPRDELWPLDDEPLRPLPRELELDDPLIPSDCELLEGSLIPSRLFWRSAINPFLLTSCFLVPTSSTPVLVGNAKLT